MFLESHNTKQVSDNCSGFLQCNTRLVSTPTTKSEDPDSLSSKPITYRSRFSYVSVFWKSKMMISLRGEHLPLGSGILDRYQ